MESEPLYNLLQFPKEVNQPAEEELPRGAGPGRARVVESEEGGRECDQVTRTRQPYLRTVHVAIYLSIRHPSSLHLCPLTHP